VLFTTVESKREAYQMEVRNVKLTLEELQQARETVLASWPTGREVDLEEAVQYQRNLPQHKVLANLLAKAEEEDNILLVGHGGRALIEEHIQLLQAFQEAGSDYLPTGTDSHTRNNRYQEAERGIEESRRAGRSLLNGLPVVCHGVKNCRKVTEAVDQPIIPRTCSPDNRLIAEVAFASGFTGFEGGALSAFSVYSAHVSLSETIRNYQYVNRLVSLYEENGVPIVREIVRYDIGAGGWPPCFDIVLGVIDALLAAEQGVHYILIQGYPQGNILQNVAEIKVADKLAREYLQRFNYRGINVYEDLSVWPGAYPTDQAQAWAVVILQAVTAVLAGVRVHVNGKTVEEGHGLPSIAASASSTRACRQVLNMFKGQRYPQSEELQLEMNMEELESRLILDKIFEMGDGDVALGAVRAFESGILDLPFSPNKWVRGKVIPARDKTGAVRFLEFGNLPFTQEVKEFHRERLAERGRAEGRSPGLEMVIDDVIGGVARLPAKLASG